ncbi:MAG: MMPL family transporter [Planctomycetes bacterium]|nr:MMPL family transporter [Planctomycetota bacterium]
MRRRIFRALAHLALHHYVAVLAVSVLLTAGAVVIGGMRGKFATNLSSLLPPGAKYCEGLRTVVGHFGSLDILLCVLEADRKEDIDDAKPLVEKFAERLAAHDDMIERVQYKVGQEQEKFIREQLAGKGYLYLDEEDFPQIEEKLSPEGMRKQLDLAMSVFRGDAAVFRQRVLPDPLNFLEVFDRHISKMGGNFRTKDAERYITSSDGRMLVVSIKAKGVAQDLEFDHRLMKMVRKDAEEVFGKAHERFDVGFTGSFAIAVQDDMTLRSDILYTFGISLAAVLALFALAFKRFGMVFYVGTPLAMSVVWTLGLAFTVFGRISIISGGFAAILVGLGIDFAIHTYNRYVEERRVTDSLEEAVENAIVKSGEGIFFGAVTTSIAFFGVTITEFSGLKELGFLAGAGVLLGMAAMLLVLPALLVAREKIGRTKLGKPEIYSFGLPYLSSFVQKHAAAAASVLFGLGAVAVAVVLLTITTEMFDSEFANLKPKHDPVMELQKRVMDGLNWNVDKAMVFTVAPTFEEALEAAAEVRGNVYGLEKEGELTGHTSLVDYIPTRKNQERVLEFLGRYDFAKVKEQFRAVAGEAGFNPKGFRDFYMRLDELAEFLEKPEFITLETLEQGGLETVARGFTTATDDAIKIDDLRYRTGHIVVTYIQPKRMEGGGLSSAWYKDVEKRLGARPGGLAAMTSVRQVGYELRDIVYDDFALITLLVFLGVWVCLLVTFSGSLRALRRPLTILIMAVLVPLLMLAGGIPFSVINVTIVAGGVFMGTLMLLGRPLRALVALLPIATGIFWMVAVMMLAEKFMPGSGFKFNYINVIVLPAIIGIGIDSGIHLVHRYAEDGEVGPSVELTGRALMMTSLTTMLGFGSLIISRYRGIKSLGMVASLGVFACLVASLVGLTALLHWLGRYIVREREVNTDGGVPEAAGAPGTEAEKER